MLRGVWTQFYVYWKYLKIVKLFFESTHSIISKLRYMLKPLDEIYLKTGRAFISEANCHTESSASTSMAHWYLSGPTWSLLLASATPQLTSYLPSRSIRSLKPFFGSCECSKLLHECAINHEFFFCSLLQTAIPLSNGPVHYVSETRWLIMKEVLSADVMKQGKIQHIKFI